MKQPLAAILFRHSQFPRNLTNMNFRIDITAKTIYNTVATQYCKKPLYEGPGFCCPFSGHKYMITRIHLFCKPFLCDYLFLYVCTKRGGGILDIMLERILSLIPKKENGDFKHGAKKEFAIGIGFKSGEIVSDWISGRSKSYEGYLYQIAALHNVSVEWLCGETDDPSPSEKKEKPPVQGGELKEIVDKLVKLDEKSLEKISKFIDVMLEE